MNDIEDLYFEWLLGRLDRDGVTEGVAYLCGLLHNCEFNRRVGNDINRAMAGIDLRQEFLAEFEEAGFAPHVTNELMAQDCSWFEMLVALSARLDYIYDGGVEGRFVELISNIELDELAIYHPDITDAKRRRDQHIVDVATTNVDRNLFNPDGVGGLFPLEKPGNPDQRSIEIWEQAAAYFREKLEGVLWTSTS